MTLIYFSLAIATLAAVAGFTMSFILRKRLARSIDHSTDFLSRLIGYRLSCMEEFRMEERASGLVPCFAIFREARGMKFDILTIGYDPEDPDDREYRRIFAEERVQILNEKP